MRIALLTMAVLSAAHQATPQGPLAPGISLELAERRGQRISDVYYTLEFELDHRMREVTGKIHARFTLAEEEQPQIPVILDFAGKDFDRLAVNEIIQGDYAVVGNHILLPAESLNPLENSFEAEFSSNVASTGTPLTLYRDPSSGAEYYYTLLVPADAHKLFPCFDQPDIKARVTLSLIVPKAWRVVANADVDEEQSEDPGFGKYRYVFEETDPLSTYLIAFATGPFSVLDRPFVGGLGEDPRRPVRLYYRGSQQAHLEGPVIMRRHREALRWLETFFGIPYPFAKLDLVLLPGFPYGGMEHAGAIFYRESDLIFDHDPTDSEETRRSTLIYHELSHQWFGNLVTMKWFDDLWLKEGFATFLAYSCLAALEPDRNAWLRFNQLVKPPAYGVDNTPGTTPIYQELDNLENAKSAYGAIVYNKAPAVLRELQERIGLRAFRQGVRRFLEDHAYENASWEDLVATLDRFSRSRLRDWSERWILEAGMPEVRAEWETDGDHITRFTIRQQGVREAAGTWPLQLELLLITDDGERQIIEVRANRAATEVKELIGKPPPACVLLNPNGVAYGKFLLDEESRAYLLQNLSEERDLLVRSVALTSLYETVRDGELEPGRFAGLLIDLLEGERDPETQRRMLGILSTCLLRYLPPDRAAPLATRITELLLGKLQEGAPGLELQMFRFLARVGEGDRVLELCRQVAAAETPYAGLRPGKRDRFLAAAALLGRGQGAEALDEVRRDMIGQDTGKEVYISGAADPSAAAKERYFLSYLKPNEPPEQWMQDSLSFFHWPGQESLTLPYLQKALDQVEWVKANRRIFFMPAWLEAFINGQSSEGALQIVEDFLDNDRLPADIRRKLLQTLDGLQRTVMIRKRWG
jgi:aminopeptidase N